jgi:hypothetical protein
LLAQFPSAVTKAEGGIVVFLVSANDDQKNPVVIGNLIANGVLDMV